MTVSQTLLGFLYSEPQHGYNLKMMFDQHFGGSRELKFGQVYSTLARLARDDLIKVVTVEIGEGPERKLYALTKSGVSAFETWLLEAQPTSEHLPGEFFAKITLALLTGHDATQILDKQRGLYLQRLRELVKVKREGDMGDVLAADYETAHIRADIEWIETVSKRLSRWELQLKKENK